MKQKMIEKAVPEDAHTEKTEGQPEIKAERQLIGKNKAHRERKTSQKWPKLSKRLIFNQIIIFFTLGCVFGTYWEEIMHLVTSFWATGVPTWESRRGLVYGPFSPVYGIGAVLIYLLFYLPRLKPGVCFVGGAVFGGALEFLLSILQEWIFGTISWDYSGRLLNIDGRTTVPYMIVWGGLVLLFTQIVYPFVDHIYRKLEAYQVNRVCVAMAIFLTFDITMSVAAVMRQTERREGDPADTKIEVFLDTRFPDERLDRIWSTTREAEK